MANKPIRTGRRGNPVIRLGILKEKRAYPVIGSSPIVAIRRPKKPAINPLTSDFPETLAIMVRPNIIRAKYSSGPNLRANRANCGAINIKQKVEIIPPVVDAIVAIPIAFPASPFWANGYPSSTVAAADGVPGIEIRIADIDPPYIAPQNIPQSMTIAVLASNW